MGVLFIDVDASKYVFQQLMIHYTIQFACDCGERRKLTFIHCNLFRLTKRRLMMSY